MTRRELAAASARLDRDLLVMLDALDGDTPAESLAVLYLDGRLSLDEYCRLRGRDVLAVAA